MYGEDYRNTNTKKTKQRELRGRTIMALITVPEIST
jgi:hypothetical protein